MQAASPWKPQVPRLSEVQRFPAQLERASKAIKHNPCISPGRRQTQRADLSCPSPRTNQWQSGGVPQTVQASVSVQRQFRCLEQPPPLHCSSQAAQLHSSLPLPTLRCYSCYQPHAGSPPPEWKGKMASAGSLPLHFLLCSHSNSFPLSASLLIIKEVLLPGVDSVSKTIIHSFNWYLSPYYTPRN